MKRASHPAKLDSLPHSYETAIHAKAFTRQRTSYLVVVPLHSASSYYTAPHNSPSLQFRPRQRISEQVTPRRQAKTNHGIAYLAANSLHLMARHDISAQTSPPRQISSVRNTTTHAKPRRHFRSLHSSTASVRNSMNRFLSLVLPSFALCSQAKGGRGFAFCT